MLNLNKTTIKIVAVVALAFAAYGWHYNATQKAVNKATSDLIVKYDKSLKDAAAKALATSKALQSNADKEREIKDDKIRTLNGKLDVALKRLSNRPTRPPNIANDPGPVQACTARGLYREDGEFLTREAARAESILIERDYYYNEYEKVRLKLNGNP